MKTVAYIANEFPSPIEPYVMDEINELRRRGVKVICCSGKRVAQGALGLAERAFWKETLYFQPLSDDQLMRAARRLASDRRSVWQMLRPLMLDRASLSLRVRALGHTLMGSALAEQLAPLKVEHIHCHHGYFASWMALVAARLLGIDFSFTLHGSDLLHRADLLDAKLRACKFCVTVSEFNRQYLFRNYPSTPAAKVMVQRLGVDPILPQLFESASKAQDHSPFCLLAVGRLHPVKDYSFLIRACGDLRSKGFDFICWIVGEGGERAALERQIAKLGLQGHVHLVGHISRHEVAGYYVHADGGDGAGEARPCS
jgi:glycosyltransferase involved in cell wall biosynthesis